MEMRGRQAKVKDLADHIAGKNAKITPEVFWECTDEVVHLVIRGGAWGKCTRMSDRTKRLTRIEFALKRD